MNDEIFLNYFHCQNPSFSAKDFIRSTKAKNKQLVNNVNDELINLRKAIIKRNPENKNPKKIVNIVEKILHLQQQNGKGLPLDLAKHIKILTPK